MNTSQFLPYPASFRRVSIPLLIALALGVAVAVLPASLAVLGFMVAISVALMFAEPLNGITVLLVVAPLKTLIETEIAYPLPLDIGQIALLAVVGLWVLNHVTRRRPLALRFSGQTQAPLLLFTFAVALSLPGALSIGAGVTELLKWIEMLFLISFCLTLYDRSETHWLVFALVLAGGTQALIGLYEFFGGSGAAHLWILDNRFFRAFGSFGQPNPFGGFMGITLTLALGATLGYAEEIWQVARHRSGPWQVALRQGRGRVALLSGIFYAVMAGLIGAGLLVSWSRGAWIGFAGAALVMLLFVPRSIVRGGLLVVAVMTLAWVAWNSNLVPTALAERVGSFAEELTTLEDVRGVDVTDSNYAVVERIAHWQAAITMAEDHPWLGVGFGNYEVAYPQYALLNWPYPLGHAHNYYLNLLAETGLVGLVTYVVAWGMIIALTVKAWRRHEGLARGWSIGLLGAWTYLTIHSLLDKLYVNNLFLHFGCMLGLLAILLIEDQRD